MEMGSEKGKKGMVMKEKRKGIRETSLRKKGERLDFLSHRIASTVLVFILTYKT